MDVGGIIAPPRVPPDAGGSIEPAAIRAAITPKTRLIAWQIAMSRVFGVMAARMAAGSMLPPASGGTRGGAMMPPTSIARKCRLSLFVYTFQVIHRAPG